MKIGFLSLGCPKNLVDGEVMLGMAQNAGHELTHDASSADVLVVNTCAFIDAAKQESIDAILEMAQFKKDGNCTRLVVTGCLGERYRDELMKEIPEIDAVLGTGEVDQILGAIGDRDAGRELRDAAGVSPLPFFARSGPVHPAPRTAELPTYLYEAETPRLQTTPKHFAYVKVAEGCDYTCAFCIIPTLRGRFRSREAASIIREARGMAERGVKELLLISQDTTFYGIDRGERGALARLLRELNQIDGLAWIRLLYLYPTTITDDVLAAMAECEKVCRYIDLPLQHASAGVLKRMRRPGDRRTYDKLLGRIREAVPGVTLRTTLIVGFPGETEEEFAELEQFMAETGFDHVGVFTYSHEEGTRAFAMPDDVPAAVKRRRRNTLMARQKRIVAAAQKARIGTIVEVLVDGPSREHELVLEGRLEGQAPEIDPVVFLTDCDPGDYPAGHLIRARIVGAKGYDLLAQPVTAP
ncbi:MAG TPA: 30S ribosomal protein S12 methylthiotransferase RimO [Vicinamibacterales bacterium]|nr:30S ribosomal protein S12 methylthiotransferase RimO [Vicinamibacterales bacterium]